MQLCKTMPILFLCMQCHNALAACDLSSWRFLRNQSMLVTGVTIENGGSPASGTLVGYQVINTNNMSSPWALSAMGSISAQNVGSGTTVRVTGITSLLRTQDEANSCDIQIKPLPEGLTQTVSQSGSYQLPLNYGADFIIPAGCQRGIYMGNANLEAYIVDPVNCPEGGMVRSENFQATMEIANIESGGATVALNNRDNLSFGSFLSPKVAGQVEISATSDTPTYTSIFKIDGNSAHRGQMEVAGTPGMQYSLMMPQTEITLYSGNNSLRLRDMTMLHQNTGQVGTQHQNLSIHQSGIDIVYIGGRLEVPARAAAGDYTGTYTVQLSY